MYGFQLNSLCERVLIMLHHYFHCRTLNLIQYPNWFLIEMAVFFQLCFCFSCKFWPSNDLFCGFTSILKYRWRLFDAKFPFNRKTNHGKFIVDGIEVEASKFPPHEIYCIIEFAVFFLPNQNRFIDQKKSWLETQRFVLVGA